MGLREKRWIRICKDNRIFVGILLLTSIYYGWRMFSIYPNVDEVVTYYWSIDKGILYALACWIAPNNHILYSALSALLNWLLPGYIGLRGISFVASIATLILLYMLLKKVYDMHIALVGTLLYIMCKLPTELAAQGRGYALSTFFLVLALYSGYCILMKENTKKWIVGFAISLWGGIYTVMTSVYWIVPICICVGCILLLSKQFKKLKDTVGWSIAAAGFTVLCYSLICFTMGASQLATNKYNLREDINILLHRPLACYKTGFLWIYDMVTLYSPGRTGINLAQIFYSFVQACFPFAAVIMAILVLVCILLCGYTGYKLIKQREVDWAKLYLAFISCIGFLLVCVMPWIQGYIVFERTFSFVGIFLVVILASGYSVLYNLIAAKFDAIKYLVVLSLTLINIALLTGTSYNEPYETQSADIKTAIEHVSWKNVDSYAGLEYYVYFNNRANAQEKLEYNEQKPDILFYDKQNDHHNADIDMTAIYENNTYIVFQR